jgi:hypothetical protein
MPGNGGGIPVYELVPVSDRFGRKRKGPYRLGLGVRMVGELLLIVVSFAV